MALTSENVDVLIKYYLLLYNSCGTDDVAAEW